MNLQDNILTIGSNIYETKTRKQRVVPIHPRVREIMMFKVQGSRFNETTITLRNKDIYVFSKGNGFKYSGDYFSRRFKRACRKAGVDEDIHFHCLRHGAITRMIFNGAPLPAVQRIAGHANIQTTMIYTHPDLESLREAVNRL